MTNRRHFASSPVIALAALAVVALSALAVPASAQQAGRPRAVVLRFEGWRADQARRAALSGLEDGYELVSEDTLVQTASRLGVDVSTPEGMASVVENLRVELVIGGFVEGTARRATTTVWVMDVRGNELSRRTTSAPSGRRGTQDIAAAAAEAAAEAIAVLHRPPPEPTEPVGTEPEPEPEMAPEHSMLREPDVSGRWNQPIVRALAGLRIRNRTASTSPMPEVNRFDSDFFPDIQLLVEVRPLALSPGAERGLYLAASGGFSAGLNYVRRDGAERGMQLYNFGFDAGYGLVIEEMVELVLSAGFGIDGFELSDAQMGGPAPDFSSTVYTFIRPAVQGRFRILPPHLLVAEVGFGGRIVVDSGPIQNVADSTSNGGFDLFVGLAGAVDPGFSWAARFAYTSYFLGFGGTPAYESGTDEAIQIWLMVGWSI